MSVFLFFFSFFFLFFPRFFCTHKQTTDSSKIRQNEGEENIAPKHQHDTDNNLKRQSLPCASTLCELRSAFGSVLLCARRQRRTGRTSLSVVARTVAAHMRARSTNTRRLRALTAHPFLMMHSSRFSLVSGHAQQMRFPSALAFTGALLDDEVVELAAVDLASVDFDAAALELIKFKHTIFSRKS